MNDDLAPFERKTLWISCTYGAGRTLYPMLSNCPFYRQPGTAAAHSHAHHPIVICSTDSRGMLPGQTGP